MNLNAYEQLIGVLQKHKWENCMTIDKASWGYRRNSGLADYLSTHELITELVETVSCGGNLLMNVAPTYDGRIMPIYEERLRDMGKWLVVNGEAIFKTKPWIHQNDTVTKDIWYTMRKTQSGTSVYAITLQWPMGNTLELGGVTPTDQLNVSLLGLHLALNWHASSKGGIFIEIPPITVNEMPCEWAWVFRLDGLK
ncbi:unnamed protein product [Owenia fusiformis]|uniref:alpha-L-fucosidase n=1 Tax=Owenia fusiformis TaxID=6347 RepID=A0A8J1U4Q1_OWEFU|nr:unnamed protein product [Owenia fusiformis]